MDWSIFISILCFIGFWIVFIAIMFWVYGFTPIFHWFIKSNSEPARAIVLEVKKAGWGWYAGGRYSQSLVFQPVKVKLEVHPNNGAAYLAQDRFNAKAKVFHESLKPGAEMQVAVFRSNPQWVASLPETITSVAAPKPVPHPRHTSNTSQTDDDVEPQEKLEQLKEMLSAGLITQQDYDKKKANILEKM